MNLGEQLLTAFSLYGLPILAAVLYIGCLGLPLPNALLLIAAGSFAGSGQMNPWLVILVGSCASIAGDLTGYLIGRWAGHAVIGRFRPGIRSRLEAAEQTVKNWGWWGIFLTRWLITPLGPAVNLLSGASHYPWPSFVIWDVAGEALWVALYVSLGRLIAGEVQAVSSLAVEISWIVLALFCAAYLLRRILRSRRPAAPEAPGVSSD